MNYDFCIIVHAGAGYHSTKKENVYNAACLEACQKASEYLRAFPKSAVQAAVLAVETLENHSVTNAGKGSNLTLEGTVECDASIMCGLTKLFGAVGALSGIVNPIRAAEKLLLQQQEHPTLSLGRIPPSVLVGQGAYDWCATAGVPTCTTDQLTSDESVSFYRRCKRKLEDHENRLVCGKTSKCKRHCASFESSRLDTVGAICLDASGNIASAVSSGGIALKSMGRVGQACSYGSGCWAEVSAKASVGVATSGTGEQLMRTLLAYKSSQKLTVGEVPVTDLSDSLKEDFVDSPFLQNDIKRSAGLIAIKYSSADDSSLADIVYAHTTDSMSIAYFSSSMKNIATLISRQSELKKNQNCVVAGGTTVKFTVKDQ